MKLEDAQKLPKKKATGLYKKNDRARSLGARPEIRERRTLVMMMIIKGHSRSAIMNEIKEKYGSTERTIAEDIVNAYKAIRTNYVTDTTELIGKHINMYYEVYMDAKQLGDSKSCIAALQAVEKLLKIGAPDNATFVQTNNYNFDKLTVEEVRQLLENYDEK